MSTKFIGVSVVAAGCLTAAVAGYVVLREPVLVPSVAVLAPAELATPMPTALPDLTQPTQPTPSSPAPATQPDVVVPAAPSASVPVRFWRTTPTSPTSPTSPTPPTPSASAPAELLRTSPTAVRYVPDPPAATDVQPPAPVVETIVTMEEVTIERNSVIGIRLDFAISTKTAKVEDRVVATVSREVTVNGRVAIPLGARLEGTVTAVDRGGRFRERPRLGLRFDRVILTDGTRLAITTDTIFREGDSPSADATAKVGAGAVAGAILGGVLGGKKGAVLGGVAGAAGGTASVMAGDGNETALREGAPLTVRLTEDLIVVVQR